MSTMHTEFVIYKYVIHEKHTLQDYQESNHRHPSKI